MRMVMKLAIHAAPPLQLAQVCFLQSDKYRKVVCPWVELTFLWQMTWYDSVHLTENDISVFVDWKRTD
jgi:hypothetical protein